MKKATSLLVSTAFLLGTSSFAQQSGVRTWQEQAKISDPNQECQAYDYPPVSSIVHKYPTIWEIADLSNPQIDQEVIQLFNQINASIPNIPPKGSPDGVWNGGYNGGQDPDCWWTYTGCTTPKDKSLKPDLTECLEPKTWGLTLDDGPNCTHNALYDYMKETNQKATLFYIGSNVLDWPLEAQRGLADNHEICAHTYSHHYMTGLTNEQAFAELYFSKKAIKDVVGVTVRCWRPPFGDVDDRIRYIAQALDMETVIWGEDSDTDDWNWVNVGIPKIEQNYKDIIGNVSSTTGRIVLTHELNNETMSLVQEFLPQIKEAYTGGVMPVAVCTNNTNPYLETEDYSYPNYQEWSSGTTTGSLAAPTALGKSQLLQFAAANNGSSSSSSSSSSASSSAATAAASSSASGPSQSKAASSASKSATGSASKGTASAALQSKTPSNTSESKDHSGATSVSVSLSVVLLVAAGALII